MSEYLLLSLKEIQKNVKRATPYLKYAEPSHWSVHLLMTISQLEVLIGSYRRAIDGGRIDEDNPKFAGQLIALLLVAQWLEHWCVSQWSRFDS